MSPMHETSDHQLSLFPHFKNISIKAQYKQTFFRTKALEIHMDDLISRHYYFSLKRAFEVVSWEGGLK